MLREIGELILEYPPVVVAFTLIQIGGAVAACLGLIDLR